MTQTYTAPNHPPDINELHPAISNLSPDGQLSAETAEAAVSTKRLARKRSDASRSNVPGSNMDHRPDSATSADPIDGADNEIETVTTELASLWRNQSDLKKSERRTHEELTELRKSLGAKLSDLHAKLARRGCEGEFGGYLNKAGIPRSTAYRLKEAHDKRTGTAANCPIGTIEAVVPTPEQIAKKVKKLSPKLGTFLVTAEAKESFIQQLRAALLRT